MGNTETCNDCNGSGKVTQKCAVCGGDSRKKTILTCACISGMSTYKCYKCEGKGYKDRRCHYCKNRSPY